MRIYKSNVEEEICEIHVLESEELMIHLENRSTLHFSKEETEVIRKRLIQTGGGTDGN